MFGAVYVPDRDPVFLMRTLVFLLLAACAPEPTPPAPLPDADADGVWDGADCAPDDPEVHPRADERCNGQDDDCDGRIDEAAVDPLRFHRDADRDGFGNPAASVAACSAPPGHVADGTDCDDTDAAAFPGAAPGDAGPDACARDADHDGFADATPRAGVTPGTDCDDAAPGVQPGAAEACDGVDTDCDGALDAAEVDADGDGAVACEPAAEWAGEPWIIGGDCDPVDPSVYPGAPEACNGRDDDCDDVIDPPSATGARPWFVDRDGDGDGDPDFPSTLACDAPGPGFVDQAADCDDVDAARSSGAPELCDGRDNDCDGAVDVAALDAGTFYTDADGDGAGDPARPVAVCAGTPGTAAAPTDCDDTRADIGPGATERCDGVDNDCDGQTDPPTAVGARTWYPDDDGDGAGRSADAFLACTDGGAAAVGGDCDDGDPAVSPAADEVCDGLDNDCDGDTDGDASVDATEWYGDADGDGLGDDRLSAFACAAPPAMVDNAADCNDGDPAVASCVASGSATEAEAFSILGAGGGFACALEWSWEAGPAATACPGCTFAFTATRTLLRATNTRCTLPTAAETHTFGLHPTAGTGGGPALLRARADGGWDVLGDATLTPATGVLRWSGTTPDVDFPCGGSPCVRSSSGLLTYEAP